MSDDRGHDNRLAVFVDFESASVAEDNTVSVISCRSGDHVGRDDHGLGQQGQDSSNSGSDALLVPGMGAFARFRNVNTAEHFVRLP